MFSVVDLFITGLGFDIAGALLLARGLLSSAAEIAQLNTWAGVAGGATVAKVRDRVDAEFGIAALILGFTVQAIGYVVSLPGSTDGAGSIAVALGGVVVSSVSVLVTWRVAGPRRVKALLPV